MKSSEKTKLLFPLILSITFAAGLWLGWLINKPAALTPGEAKLQELFGIINREYVDSVDLDSLIERSLPSILYNSKFTMTRCALSRLFPVVRHNVSV